MRTEICGEIPLNDFEPAAEDFQSEFKAGLKSRPRRLPCKFFYDAQGSRLFDAICQVPEYYLTRTESGILRDHVREIVDLCGPSCVLIELGSGSSSKTRLLLDHLIAPAGYVPIDISRAHLLGASETLKHDYPDMEVLPVCADYNQPLTLPAPVELARRRVLFFPGSTIGNFEPAQAAAFLERLGGWCKPGDGLLVGVDLEKAPEILEPAYNDAQGVTAAFNLNLLHRANRELGANFHTSDFHHQALYDALHRRIEMQLLSCCSQTVWIDGEQFDFERDEAITTEYSYKYRQTDFCALASAAHWILRQSWTDPNRWFSVFLFDFRGA